MSGGKIAEHKNVNTNCTLQSSILRSMGHEHTCSSINWHQQLFKHWPGVTHFTPPKMAEHTGCTTWIG